MENLPKSNLLNFFYIGESDEDYTHIKQIIIKDLLPISPSTENNLSKALFDLNRLSPYRVPEVIILNVDHQGSSCTEFLKQYHKHIYPDLKEVLFYVSATHIPTMEMWQNTYPFITGFIQKPYLRRSFEQIATRLLNQFLPPIDLYIDLSN